VNKIAWKIPLFKIYWDKNDLEAVNEVLTSGMYWSSGSKISDFENLIKNYLGAECCVTFNSGGSALHALMLAYGYQPGDEIIVPSFAYIGTAYTPLYVGAKPIFSDIEYDTFGLDPEDVKEKITSHTKAILPIHYGGTPCNIQALREISSDHNLALIEDAAEAFGAKERGKLLGTFGDSSIFSFSQNKVFTTAEGGCVVTNNNELERRLRHIVSYGREYKGDCGTNKDIDYVTLGYNWRLSTILAALGISQIKKVEKLIKMRRKKAETYNKQLGELPQIRVPKDTNGSYSVYQLYTIRLIDENYSRNSFQEYLSKKGIFTKIYFDPIHQYSIFKNLGYEDIELPITDRISSEVLSLPIYPHMMQDELNYIISSVKEYFGWLNNE
jgi:perosamine synthetase